MSYNNREYQHTYIPNAGTTTCFLGRGNLGGINLNGAAAGTIQIIDGLTPTTGTTVAILASGTAAGRYLPGLVISAGLHIGVITASNITVAWTQG